MVNQPGSVSAVTAWGLNIVSSVGIIMVNKAVMSGYGFVFATTLTGLHFVVTGIVGAISSALGYSSSKVAVPFWELAWFSIVANLSIVGMNLSLMLNSVGFYQIAKLSIIPTVCVFEALINQKSYTQEVKLSVLVVMVGVGICTITDIDIRPAGLLAAVVAVVTTSLQQIFIGVLQKKYSIGSMDLLGQTAPIQAASLVLLGPFIDFGLLGKNVLLFDFTLMATIAIVASCLLSVLVNLSQYLCIGKFSATTFQVLGHMKTILVLFMGWMLFNSKITLKLFGGMFIAVVGMILYSWAVEKAKKQEATDSKAAALTSTTPKTPKTPGAEEKTPLMSQDVEAGKTDK